MKNGAVIVKGEHYEQFLKDYYGYESMETERIDDIVIEGVSPSQIEGIELSPKDLDDPSGFWSMHASSKERFEELASHIPEVQSALNSGLTLDELKSDPVLGSCATQFFDPKVMPRVEKWGDYYYFGGDGRHRIITARELGYNIPVRITCIRRHR